MELQDTENLPEGTASRQALVHGAVRLYALMRDVAATEWHCSPGCEQARPFVAIDLLMMLMGQSTLRYITPCQVVVALCQAVLAIWQQCSPSDFCWRPEPSKTSLLPPNDGPYFCGCYMPDLIANFVPVLIWLLHMRDCDKIPARRVYCAAIYLLANMYVDNPDVPVWVFAQEPALNVVLRATRLLSMQDEVLTDHSDTLVAAILCRLRAFDVPEEEDNLPAAAYVVTCFVEPSVVCFRTLIKVRWLLSSTRCLPM